MKRDIRLTFDRGTLLLDNVESAPDRFVFDERVNLHRAPGVAYRDTFAALHRAHGDDVVDEAREYGPVDVRFRAKRTPFDHQREGVQAWLSGGRQGLVVLPTGSGKTFVAELIIEQVKRSTLVVVPTIDLMNQWYARLLEAFDIDEIGLVGGGYYEIRDLTVTTYDSFSIHAERLGNRFGLLIFDEVHHLPSTSYAAASQCYIAPFRLGLTATPEREGEPIEVYDDLVGPVVYRKEIKELAGQHLADYETRRLSVPLTDDERERYATARGVYTNFIRANGIRMGSRTGWSEFIMRSSQSRSGRRAMLAYREQKAVAMSCSKKMELLEVLLTRHAEGRVIIFTNNNDAVYRISQRFLIPAITHQTPVKERKEIIDGIKTGRYGAVATSRVLNEGVDIPTANVAIVMSGSGSVREHVQRLGRILRRAKDKQATLYELIAEDTMEGWVSERRRDHDAYR